MKYHRIVTEEKLKDEIDGFKVFLKYLKKNKKSVSEYSLVIKNTKELILYLQKELIKLKLK